MREELIILFYCFQDESRLKSTVMTAQAVDYKDANAKLIKQIKTATGIELN